MRPSPQFFARETVRPLIQQFLANVDPDVDAIYRLTQPLGITFDAAAFNVLLPRGSFCPFNRYDVDFGLSATFATTSPTMYCTVLLQSKHLVLRGSFMGSTYTSQHSVSGL